MAARPAARLTMHRAAALLLIALPCAAPAAQAQDIPLRAFQDAINHWQSGHGTDYPRYRPDQYREIADNLVLLQHRGGGWAVNQDPQRILDDRARAEVVAAQATAGGSFDNRNIHTQVAYLAQAFDRSGDPRYRQAAVRGLDFILAEQIPACGGWPHSVPSRTAYHGHVTFADDVTSGVLTTLRRVQQDPVFAFIDADQRARVDRAVRQGDACVLRLQVRQGDALTIWAGQYDPATLQPAQGRSFELPALVVDESVGVVRYLMSIPDPSPEVIAAVDGAMAWFQAHALQGVRLETFDAAPEQFQHHRSTIDRRLVDDPGAPPLWGRFHDLRDSTVVLANREGERVARFDQVPRERRTGYHWYGTWPQALITTDYPRWQQRLARTGAR
ncbi:pectate lyase [Stenotrophomonas maltophilia]|uniref:Pectate lyase n=1 Tax=Stenotrophomonas maltophilia TaxID=40324 RepID=A0A4S2CXA1_STEMA|nr:pectate lyase [Stenotrophomonas maltophilia]TGY33182.1 pectate lyase [Stenotrophomonas maltophilia]